MSSGAGLESNNLVYAASFGSSSGSVSCINTTHSNAVVSTFASINRLGKNTIQCTATSGANKSNTVTATYQMGYEIPLSRLSIEGNASKTDSKITLSNSSTQFGPYISASKGCYNVWYYGNNLNTYIQGFEAYTNNFEIYQLKSLNYVSSNANYFIYISKDTESLELILRNQGSLPIEITRIHVISYGESCPY